MHGPSAFSGCAWQFTTDLSAIDRTKSAPSLWTLHIDFEVKNGELKRAKSLIYRAIRECPWCKGEQASDVRTHPRNDTDESALMQTSTFDPSRLRCAQSIVPTNSETFTISCSRRVFESASTSTASCRALRPRTWRPKTPRTWCRSIKRARTFFLSASG